MLTTSSREVTALKGDIQKALHERNDTLAKCNRLESQVQELKDELIRTKDQYQTARQLIEDYKTQIHNSKIELEASHTRLLNREKELKWVSFLFFKRREFEETNLAQSKSTILYKDETVKKLFSSEL